MAQCDFPCEHGCGLIAQPLVLRDHQAVCNHAPVCCPVSDDSEHCPLVVPSEILAHIRTSRHTCKKRSSICIAKKDGDRHVVTLSPGSGGYSFNVDYFDDSPGMCYLVEFSDDRRDGHLVDLKFPRDGSMSTPIVHIRVFHFVKPRLFTLTLGSKVGPCMTVSGKTEPMSNGGYMDPGFVKKEQGWVLLRERAVAIASNGGGGTRLVQLHLILEDEPIAIEV